MELQTYYSKLLLVCLIIILTVQNIKACSCVSADAQRKYCSDSFVVLARIDKKDLSGDKIIYNVEIKEAFKLPNDGDKIINDSRLYTPKDSAACGVNLSVGETYVLSGYFRDDKPTLGLCGLIWKWSNVSEQERENFRQHYKEGCAKKEEE